ncbi:hypothetical protein ACVIGB_001115 [Bradyrhizobium sp. USDA 4341]
MPDPAFVASLATNRGKLKSVRSLDDYDNPVLEREALDDLIAETTPLKDADYGRLYTYMARRFGYASIGGDSGKDLSGYWLLTSPEPDVFVMVSPSLNGSVFTFHPMIQLDGKAEAQRETLPRSELERVAQAYRAVLLDLLRPVSVRDSWINALGIVDDESELLEGDDEQPFIAPYEPTSTRGIPSQLIAGPNWWPMIAIINHLGGGDITEGRDRLLALGRRAIFEEFRRENLDVRMLASIGIGDGWEDLFFDAERDVYLDGSLTPDLAERRARMKREIAAPIVGDGAAPGTLITSELIGKAVPIIRVLSPNSYLPQQLHALQVNRQLVAEWNIMARIVGNGEFPDACIPERLDETSLKALPDVLEREGALELAAWAKRLTSEQGGLPIAFEIMARLQRSMRETKSSGPSP